MNLTVDEWYALKKLSKTNDSLTIERWGVPPEIANHLLELGFIRTLQTMSQRWEKTISYVMTARGDEALAGRPEQTGMSNREKALLRDTLYEISSALERLNDALADAEHVNGPVAEVEAIKRNIRELCR